MGQTSWSANCEGLWPRAESETPPTGRLETCPTRRQNENGCLTFERACKRGLIIDDRWNHGGCQIAKDPRELAPPPPIRPRPLQPVR